MYPSKTGIPLLVTDFTSRLAGPALEPMLITSTSKVTLCPTSGLSGMIRIFLTSKIACSNTKL